MKNNPLLYIDSINTIKEGKENLETYDSRKVSKKKIAKHRLDDIRAMLLYKINILCIVKTSQVYIEGVVYSIDENYLNIISNSKNVLIALEDIEDINILKI